MTPVGHALFGASLAYAVMPFRWSFKAKTATVAACLFLANTPDLRLPHWGHTRYDISHSVFSTLALGGSLALVAWFLLRKKMAQRTLLHLLGLFVAAWLSHILLDTTYNHGKGIAIWWPFGEGRVALTLPWFAVIDAPLPEMTPHNVRIIQVEAIAYGLVLGVVLAARRLVALRRER